MKLIGKKQFRKTILILSIVILTFVGGISFFKKKQSGDETSKFVGGNPYVFKHIQETTNEYEIWHEYVSLRYKYKVKYPIVSPQLIDPSGRDNYYQDGKYLIPEEENNSRDVNLLPAPPFGPGFTIIMRDNPDKKSIKQFFFDDFSDLECDDKTKMCYMDNPYFGSTEDFYTARKYKDDKKLPQLIFETLTISGRQAIRVEPHIEFWGSSDWYRIYIYPNLQTVMEIYGEYETDLTRTMLDSIEFF